MTENSTPGKSSGRVKKPSPLRETRAGIIATVQTPLGFFALVVLVVEAILGLTAGLVRGVNPADVVTAMVALIFLLVLVVAGLAFYRPEALQGKRWRQPQAPLPVTAAPPAVESLRKPSILCVSTPDFEKLGTDQDIAILSENFQSNLTVRRNVTSGSLRSILTEKRYSIVHLLAYVDAATGALSFGPHDQLAAEGLQRLIEVCEAKLVVLATCDSVLLAAKISHTANMVAAIGSMSDHDFIEWERCFYSLLSRGQPLSRAYDVARATTNAPVVLLMRKELAVEQ
jgi:hypothetical protein